MRRTKLALIILLSVVSISCDNVDEYHQLKLNGYDLKNAFMTADTEFLFFHNFKKGDFFVAILTPNGDIENGFKGKFYATQNPFYYDDNMVVVFGNKRNLFSTKGCFYLYNIARKTVKKYMIPNDKISGFYLYSDNIIFTADKSNSLYRLSLGNGQISKYEMNSFRYRIMTINSDLYVVSGKEVFLIKDNILVNSPEVDMTQLVEVSVNRFEKIVNLNLFNKYKALIGNY